MPPLSYKVARDISDASVLREVVHRPMGNKWLRRLARAPRLERGCAKFLYKCRILHPFFIDWVAHHPAPRFHRRLAALRTRDVYLETSLVYYVIKVS
jgi:hypothetical protein